MTVAGTIIGTALGAWIAGRAYQLTRAERSDLFAMEAAAKLCAVTCWRPIPEPIHPDQDCIGDMPEKSSVQLAIEDITARANHFGGDHRLRYPSRWRARFIEPRPAPVKRDWL